jgi:tetraacyldisaccharide 4'-kinase
LNSRVTIRQNISNAVQQAWLNRGALACLLWPVSLLFGLLVKVRRLMYRAGVLKSVRVGVPVLVVGNVVAGGAGKTPLVMALVRHFQGQGMAVGVVSRGYGRTGKTCQEVLSSTHVLESGDEAALIKRATGAPVFVASKRIEAAQALLNAYPATQLLICDDGLQHYALARDIEVVVFDDRGAGNGWLLPAGPLREPWPQRLHSGISLVLHTGSKPAFDGYVASRKLADHAVAADGRKVTLQSLQAQPLVALAAIAHPEAFFTMLKECGLSLAETIALPDHDDFAHHALPVKNGTTLLCTEKDAVKLFGSPEMAAVNLLAVPLEFAPEPAFLEALDALLAPLLSASRFSQLPSAHGH